VNQIIRQIETELVCSGGRPRRAFVLCDMSRRQAKVFSAHDPGPCSSLDICCYLPPVAAHVLVFAREIPRPCNFRCYLQRPQLILQANFGASGLINDRVRRSAPSSGRKP
jgi:hypothetical protein